MHADTHVGSLLLWYFSPWEQKAANTIDYVRRGACAAASRLDENKMSRFWKKIWSKKIHNFLVWDPITVCHFFRSLLAGWYMIYVPQSPLQKEKLRQIPEPCQTSNSSMDERSPCQLNPPRTGMTRFELKTHYPELCMQWSVWAKVSCYGMSTDNKNYRALTTGCVCISRNH